MSHPSDGHLQAWLDGELEPGEATGVGEHLGSCAECAERAEVLRGESEGFSHAMLALDERVGSPADPGPLPVAAALSGARGRRLRYTGWSLARAAGLILVAAGAAAALVPGSPVREWLASLGDSGETVVVAPAESAPDMVAGAEGSSTAGPTAISVEPRSGELFISLRGFGRDSNVHVRLTDALRASVRVEGSPDAPRFVTGPGTLEVIGATEGEIWVELPRSVRDAVVEVDDKAAVRIEDGQLVILWPVMDSLRGDVVFRIGG
jgi:hypothetical protein